MILKLNKNLKDSRHVKMGGKNRCGILKEQQANWHNGSVLGGSTQETALMSWLRPDKTQSSSLADCVCMFWEYIGSLKAKNMV